MRIRVARVAGLIALLAAGCGSSGSPGIGGRGGAGGQAGAAGGGTGGGNDSVTWDDQGAAVVATQVSTAFYVLDGRDNLDISASTTALSLRLIVSDAPPLAAKDFTCNQPTIGPSATAAYSDVNTGGPFTLTGCTVTVTQVGSSGGSPAVGTFSVRFSAAGGLRTLTNGAFSVRY